MKLAKLTEMEVKHRCNQILELGFPLEGLAKLFAQDWEGDVTVVMPATLAQYSKLLQNPSAMELQKAANQGRRCTWEKLSAIKANCGIELALDESVAMLNHMRRLKKSADRAAVSHGTIPSVRFNGSKRIPSWNCMARENVHDLSDSDQSESADLSSWTRSGGPLMRTASADKFIDFVHNLDKGSTIDPNERSCSDAELEQTYRNPFTGSTTIMVTEGDFLQPERSHNGIVFNVVKRGDLTPSSMSHGSENTNGFVHDSSLECVQLDCLEKETDTSSDDGADSEL